MTDVHSKEVRSYNMSRIKSINTKPEMIVRSFLFRRGYRYRIHNKNLPGKPDIVFPKYKAVIFIHGCFWHGHEGCKYFVIPKTRTEWWLQKINRNKELDDLADKKLAKLGWKIITVFECDLKGEKKEKTLLKILKKLGYSNN